MFYKVTSCRNPVNLAKIQKSLPDRFQNSLICAGDKLSRKGICLGDSGGPMVTFDSSLKNQHYVQIGVIHGGIQECSNDVFPAIIVRLDNPDILDFVQNAIYDSNNFKKSRSKFIQANNIKVLF